jgi:hypothetical protein
MSESNTTTELLPCPFCGSTAGFSKQDYGRDEESEAPIFWAVHCPNCECGTAYGEEVEGNTDECKMAVAKKWNTRAVNAEKEAAYKAMYEALKAVRRFLESGHLKSPVDAALELADKQNQKNQNLS